MPSDTVCAEMGTLKVTYSDMRGITRSHMAPGCDSAAAIYRESVRLLDKVEKRPVRLIGVGIYRFSDQSDTQLTLENLFSRNGTEPDEELLHLLSSLQNHYHLDFAGHLDQIFQMDLLHKTVEYMRKHF